MKLKYYNNILYSIWLKNSFKKCGRGLNIKAPIYLKGAKYISLGDNFSADYRLRLEAWNEYRGERFDPQIIIGNNVSLNFDCHIGCINKIIIGDNVLMASKIFITDHFHGEIIPEILDIPPVMRNLFSKGPVIIEDNVWIGEGVVILPNVRIGKNSIIGANSVITKDVVPNSVVAGNPARIIKTLN